MMREIGARMASACTLTATLAEPLLGDCDQNGIVDFLDIQHLIAVLSSNSFLAEADVNQDGEVNFLDIQPFIAILAGN